MAIVNYTEHAALGGASTLARFVKEVSLTLHKSVTLSVNQSLEHIIRQYFPAGE